MPSLVSEAGIILRAPAQGNRNKDSRLSLRDGMLAVLAVALDNRPP